jgi:hypothetical protein
VTFKNKLPGPITFELGGTQYAVDGNGTIEIPERFVFAVSLMGLPLEDLETATRPSPPAPVVEPVAPVVPDPAPSDAHPAPTKRK